MDSHTGPLMPGPRLRRGLTTQGDHETYLRLSPNWPPTATHMSR
jgi:hypothetical protein